MAHDEKFFMCPPSYYDVEYVINPWMKGNLGGVDRDEAAREWDGLYRALSNLAEVETIEPKSGLPDMVFTANAGLVYGDTYIPSRFRYPHRQGESDYFSKWFVSRNFTLTEMPRNSTFEGEGDALLQPGEPLLWAGYGVRTSLFAHRFLNDIFDIEIVPLRLVDERFYHLDMCFCPLPGGRVFYYPDAFDRESLDAIRTRVPADKRCEVDPEDAFRFACNSVQTCRNACRGKSPVCSIMITGMLQLKENPTDGSKNKLVLDPDNQRNYAGISVFGFSSQGNSRELTVNCE